MKFNSTSRIVLLVFFFLMVLPTAACIICLGTFDLKSHPQVDMGLKLWIMAVGIGLMIWAWATGRLKSRT